MLKAPEELKELAVDKQLNSSAVPDDEWRAALPYAEEISRVIQDERVEIFVGYLAFLSCLVFALETLPELTMQQDAVLSVLEYGICATFSVAYLLRWYATNLDPRHPLNPIEIIDFLSFAPLLSQPFSLDPSEALGSGFAVLRSFRALRLQRFVQDEASFARLQIALNLRSEEEEVVAGSRRQLRVGLRVARVVSSVLTLLFVASGLIYEFEHLSNPQFRTFFDALYFGLTTLTTVGYGDITPITFAGKLTVCASIVVGVAVVPVQLAELGDVFLREGDERDSGTAGAKVWARQQSPMSTDAPRLLTFDLACGSCGEAVHLQGSHFCRICGGDVTCD